MTIRTRGRGKLWQISRTSLLVREDFGELLYNHMHNGMEK